MVEKTDEYDFDNELVRYYGEKVQQLENVRRVLRRFEKRRKSGEGVVTSTGRYESEEDFEEALNDLLFFAWPKIKKSSNLDVPSDLDEKIDDRVYTVDDLSREEKKRLTYLIRDLFEAFNITSLEREKWETEGLGVVDKSKGKDGGRSS